MNRATHRNGHKPGKYGSDSDPGLLALREAVTEAIDRHHRLGHPVVVMKDGRAIWLYPDGREVPLTASGRHPGKAKRPARP